jgi:hypothetical protein
MRRRNAAGIRPYRKILEPLQPHFKLAAMAAIAALPLLLLSALLPRPLVLPVLCLIALAGATIAALLAWGRGAVRNSRQVTAWDVAGALAFIGFAAAMLSNPEQVIYLTEAATTPTTLVRTE